MIDLLTLRNTLTAQKATWRLSADLARTTGPQCGFEVSDRTLLAELAAQFHLGSLPARSGTLTARLPRMRPPLASAILPRRPGVNRLIRRVALGGGALPTSWDWRNVGGRSFVSPVRNQGGCGSCVAFATAAAVEAHHRIETNQPTETLDLSEASLFFVANRQCNVGDPRYGWWIGPALDAAMAEGIAYEANYPYVATNQVADIPNGTSQTIKIRGYDSTTSTAQMKRWLVESGPLVTAFTVYNDFFAFFNSGTGTYQHVTGAVAGGHAVCVIGYDDGAGAWICKNSWGTSATHADGCFLIRYGEGGIDDRMYVPQDVQDTFTVDTIPYDPNRLYIANRGALGWMLTDGRMSMRLFDTAEDARNGLRVARRHTQQCFVGRDNPRANRRDYILEYWDGNSGLPAEPLTQTDSIPYSATNVKALDLDAAGWRIHDGDHWMLLAHDMNDALAVLQVVERHSRIAFIGRGNHRANRSDYIMTYFE